MKFYSNVFLILIFCISCKSLDVQTVVTGSLNNDSIYIKNIRIHNEGFADIKDSLASNIVFCLQKHNFKSASYFTAPDAESEYRYSAIVDVFVTTTGDIFKPQHHLSLYMIIQQPPIHIATIQVISQSYDIKRSDDQCAIAQALASKIDEMVQKK